ncbi:hypothetical protein BDZ45DRAFT_748496 [Acephala macrosclerotiorum]|nr:hypothetical protein BDZ45DRAFT_748496 [Acephala macrosclerotiorum]
MSYRNASHYRTLPMPHRNQQAMTSPMSGPMLTSFQNLNFNSHPTPALAPESLRLPPISNRISIDSMLNPITSPAQTSSPSQPEALPPQPEHKNRRGKIPIPIQGRGWDCPVPFCKWSFACEAWLRRHFSGHKGSPETLLTSYLAEHQKQKLPRRVPKSTRRYKQTPAPRPHRRPGRTAPGRDRGRACPFPTCPWSFKFPHQVRLHVRRAHGEDALMELCARGEEEEKIDQLLDEKSEVEFSVDGQTLHGISPAPAPDSQNSILILPPQLPTHHHFHIRHPKTSNPPPPPKIFLKAGRGHDCPFCP